jgi:hypothetical protein
MKHEFKSKLIGRGPGNAWTFLPIPEQVTRACATKSRVAVRGTINGFPFRTSLLPEGDGTHAMPVNKGMLQGAGTAAGQIVTVIMEIDTAARTVEVPGDMNEALREPGTLQSAFESLSYSRQKEFVDWIEQAKRPETRAKRLRKMLVLLEEGRSPKG